MKVNDIKELAGFTSPHGLCVSLFLNIDKKHLDSHDIDSTLNHLINEEEKNLSAGHDSAKHLRNDFGRIREFIKNLDTGNNRGLAIFTCAEADYFKVFYLTREVENRITFSQKFLIRPLVRYLDDNSKILAVFTDRKRARLVEMDEGEIKRFIEFEDDVPKQVKAGSHYGLADKRIERHVEWHVHNHFKKVAEMTLDLLFEDGYEWLFIYTQPDDIKEFEGLLHSYTKRKVAFEKQVDLMEAKKERYLNEILDSLKKVEEEKHSELNDELFEAFPHRAVLGVMDVTYELKRKSVFKLVLSNRFSNIWPVCGNCDYRLHNELICSNCGANMSFADWETNFLIIDALKQDGEVHFIDSDSLDKKGGIGAILRYEAYKQVS